MNSYMDAIKKKNEMITRCNDFYNTPEEMRNFFRQKKLKTDQFRISTCNLHRIRLRCARFN